MATKGIVDTAKKLVTSAVDAFNDAPLAPDTTEPKRRRSPSKKAAKKSPTRSSAKRTATTRDGKLVSTMEDYEVKYLAQKHGVTQKAVKAAVASVGHSRNKVEAELKRSKG